jgi:uncharacterized membrane protein YdfJ with MMPL/SSD domain
MAKLLFHVGHFAAKHRLLVLLAWIGIAAGIGALVSRIGADTNDNLSLPGTGSQEATDLLAEEFPPQQNGQSPIVFKVKTGKVSDSANKTAIEDSYKAIVKVPHVYSATDPFSQQGAAQISKDETIAYIPVLLDISASDLTEEEAQAVLDAAEPGQKAGMQVAAGGPIGSELSTPETESSEVIGIVAAMIILTFAFGTVVAMGMPIVTAIIALSAGLGLIGLLGHLVQVPSIAPTLATMIGLGVGIDYALFVVMRHLHNIRDGMEIRESIARTIATTGTAIVFAGTTVVVALLALAVAGIPLVTSLGYSSAVAVVTAVLAAVTLMPALLSLVGHKVLSLQLPSFLRPKPKEPGRGFWAGWARTVTDHPWLAVLAAVVVLVPLTIPLFSLELGQEDIGATPKSTQERQAYDLMSEGFGPGYNGPFLIAVELDPVATTDPVVAENLADAQALQDELEQEQQEGQEQQQQLQEQGDELKAEQATLEQQQAELEQQAAELQQQQARLEEEGAELESQAAALRAEERRLRVEEDRLRAQERVVRAEEASIRLRARRLFGEAERLLRRGKATEAELAAVQSQEAELEEEIAAATDPQELEDLQAQLAALLSQEAELEEEIAAATDPQELEDLQAQLVQLQQAEAALETELDLLRRRGQNLAKRARGLLAQAVETRERADGLRAEAARLATQAAPVAAEAAELERQKQELEAQGAELARQGAELEQEGDELKAQGDQLQQQADELEAQQADLEALQQEAQVQQQEAEELQDTLTAQLTSAGGDDRGTDPRLVALQNALTDTDGVQALSPPLINTSGSAAIFSLIPTTAPADPETADLVVTLRDTVIPDALSTSMGIEAFVGGSTAGNVDLAAEITAKLPIVIVTVLGLSIIVLLLAFRSLLVPLQAALTNVVCVGASFGVLTACFQWGWGLELVGIDVASGTDPIASYVPLMMFAVLFGLSMDYQVFLLSQVDLHRVQGENDHDAVRSGLALSARVITAAALIMIFVFGSFILNGDPVVKQFGVGLAVAVALAGVMVMLLSPAILVLLGRGTWWIPRWLDRLLPNMDIEGEAFRAGPKPPAAPIEAPRTGGP